MKKFKTIPKFRNEDEERDFWANVEFPNLKMTDFKKLKKLMLNK